MYFINSKQVHGIAPGLFEQHRGSPLSVKFIVYYPSVNLSLFSFLQQQKQPLLYQSDFSTTAKSPFDSMTRLPII